MKRTVQKLSREYIKESSKLTNEQRLKFLEEYQTLFFGTRSKKSKSRLISLKINESLLEAFRIKSTALGTPYQTQIKKLMEEWLKNS